MGKESLIKSTTKQESNAKSEDAREKDTQDAAKNQTPTQSKPKTQPRKTAAAAKKPAAKPKSATRKKTPAKSKTTAPKKPAVKAKTTTRKKTSAASKSTVASKKSTTPKAKTGAKAAPKKPPQAKAAPKAEATKPAAEAAELKKKAAPEKEAQIPETPIPAAQLPPSEPPPADPANRMMQFGLAGFVLLVLLVIIASWMNTQNYYIKPGEGAIEIWQGKFAPLGEELLMSIPGIAAPEPIKDNYSKNEVYPIFYQFYLDKADTLLEVPGMPDFEGVKTYLNTARSYATTSQMKTVVKSRSNALTRMVLLYKADVAASKDTPEDLKTAISLYKEARSYAADDGEAARIKRKIDAVDRRLEKIKAAAALEKKKQKSK